MGTLHAPQTLLTRDAQIYPESESGPGRLRFDPLEWQRQTLVSGNPKEVAYAAGCSVRYLWQLARGQYPPSVYLAFTLARTQKDFRFLIGLAERAGALLYVPAPRLDKRPVILLLADLALSFGRFFELSEKLQRNEPLTDEETRILEEEGEKMKEAIDATVQRNRKQRQESDGEQGK